jgi:hypothetical protein
MATYVCCGSTCMSGLGLGYNEMKRCQYTVTSRSNELAGMEQLTNVLAMSSVETPSWGARNGVGVMSPTGVPSLKQTDLRR